jgi:hypothetical protein
MKKRKQVFTCGQTLYLKFFVILTIGNVSPFASGTA